jgi:large subunit ribosomal protein L35
MEIKMPKLKTKSGIKKRFRTNAAGKIIIGQAGKRHNLRKRSNEFLRNARGTVVMDETDAKRIRRLMPYGL